MSKKPNVNEKLFSEFPPVSEKAWKEQVMSELKGKEFEKLNWKTYEDIDLPPFYTEEDVGQLKNQTDSQPGEFPFVRGGSFKNNDWKINQEINGTDIKQANRLALNSIKGGADSVTFNCLLYGSKYHGIPVQNKDDMASLLDGIDIESTAINFNPGVNTTGILSLYINEARKRGVKLENLSGSVNCDPIKDLTLQGLFLKGEANSFEELRAVISYLSNYIPNYKGLKVNSSQFQDSGASITQELAYTLSSGVEYLDRLTGMDLSIDQISRHMAFSFSISSNYFMEIAKLRAARLLWAKIIKQYKPKHESSMLMNIEVTNSSWNKTQYNPFVNLLRGTVETMAGALGGAGIITVRPLDSEYKTPDDFSQRMSRNTQLILKNETYLERVVDPSAGSYYVENLTDSIAKESWRLFQEVESGGGIIKSLKSVAIQNAIEQTRKSRDMNTAIRKDIFLGVNQYPNSDEQILSKMQNDSPVVDINKSDSKLSRQEKLSVDFAAEYLSNEVASIGDLLFQRPETPEFQIEPLKPYRGAQIFEELRLATEKHAQITGHTPVVFLLTIGNPSMRSARASFAVNFFGCAGFHIVNNIGFDSPEDGVRAALEYRADIVVVCSSDDEYPQIIPSIIKGLGQKSPGTIVIVAGYPKEHIEGLEKAGVDDFIHIRSNALEILSKYQKILGIGQGRQN